MHLHKAIGKETEHKMTKWATVILLSFCWLFVASQPDTSRKEILLNTTVIEGDTIPWEALDEVLVLNQPTFSNQEAKRKYYILRRKVIKVYPYAVLAGNKLDSLNLRLSKIKSKRKRKRHIKKYQKFLEEKFEPELRNLTRSEGQILSKLIYRETNTTVFDLIKEYRSGWSAFWWNASASWYDIDLKKPYSPTTNKEDKLIENILLRAISQGLLQERKSFYPPQ